MFFIKRNHTNKLLSLYVESEKEIKPYVLHCTLTISKHLQDLLLVKELTCGTKIYSCEFYCLSKIYYFSSKKRFIIYFSHVL